jgi:CheY-like chemotaxis protein
MSKILLVDDDAVIAEIYRRKVTKQNFQVAVALDGLAAMKILSEFKPDLVVLDMMMPKFGGSDVLKYIRSHPYLKNTYVVVLSNFYFSDDEKTAATAQADKALSKASCPPALLIEEINKLLSGPLRAESGSPGTPGSAAAPPPGAAATASLAGAEPSPGKEAEAEVQERNRRDFLKNGPATLATLRQMNEAFVKSVSPQARTVHLLDFYRKTHFVTAMAGLTGCEQIALCSSAFEALLFELYEKPQHIGPSALRTIADTLDFFSLLFAHADRTPAARQKPPKALVVDDDPLSIRAMAMALRRANLAVTGIEDPGTALKKIEQDQYDLILLDIEMPGMDGFKLCERVRVLPQYRRTPIIFVTGYADFESRNQSVVSGGNDFIAKPVISIELAVKAVTHLLRSQLPEE